MITQKELKKLFHYNPDTGIFTRLQRAGNFQPGSMAGSYSGRYARICIRKKHYLMQMKHNNKNVTIGRFLKKEDAIKARREADKHYGFHENHGNPNN